MTADTVPLLDAGSDSEIGAEPLHLVGGRLVSLHQLMSALRRRRRLWLALALIGLVIGAGYHGVVPVKYSAGTTLYLAHPAGTDSTVVAQNDLAMLDTAAVGRQAIALLGPAGKGLTPTKLLGKTPGVVTSGNVLTVTISGPTPVAAVRRSNAVAQAYLAFRANLYTAQNTDFVTASNKQISKLQAEVATLDGRIAASPTPSSPQVSNLESERAAATTQISALQQSIVQGDLNTLSVVKGSRVITPATAATGSQKKAILLDGLTGLGAGLAVGLGIVVVAVALSDRLRRREDVATLIGAPVDLSVGRVRRRGKGRHSLMALSASDEVDVRMVTQYLEDQLGPRGSTSTELVVAVDDAALPAAALLAVARTLAGEGEQVVVVDETATRVIARSLATAEPGLYRLSLGGGLDARLLVPPHRWEAGGEGAAPGEDAPIAGADAVLVIASVDPAIGAWHLSQWGSEAVLSLTAGASSTHSIAAVRELLEAAGIQVRSAVLVGADPDDESSGLPAHRSAAPVRHLGLVRTTGSSLP